MRPYAYEFLRAIFSFFEIVATSNIKKRTMLAILNHIERKINDPNPFQQQGGNKLNCIKISQCFEFKKVPKGKVFFDILMY